MIRSEVRDHVAEVIIDNPPVNALPVAGWFELADTIRRLGADPEVRALIVAGNPELAGFQVGVDIKELAADPTNESLIGVNRGCYETFAAVYDCEVPVIAAIHGYCLGGGVGIAGNADIVVAADDLPARAPRGRPRRARCWRRTLAPRARAQDARDVPHGRDGRCASSCSSWGPSSASCRVPSCSTRHGRSRS